MKKIFFAPAFIFVLGAVTLFLASCSDKTYLEKNKKGELVFAISANYTSIYKELFVKKCSECHVPGGVGTEDGAEIDFSNAALGYSTTVGKTVTGVSSAGVCSGAKIIGSNAKASYMLAVFFSDYGLGSNNWGGITGCKPYDHTAFQNSIPSNAEKAALVQWMNNGAPNN